MSIARKTRRLPSKLAIPSKHNFVFGNKVSEKDAKEYIQAFTAMNHLKPSTFIINGKKENV